MNNDLAILVDTTAGWTPLYALASSYEYPLTPAAYHHNIRIGLFWLPYRERCERWIVCLRQTSTIRATSTVLLSTPNEPRRHYGSLTGRKILVFNWLSRRFHTDPFTCRLDNCLCSSRNSQFSDAPSEQPQVEDIEHQVGPARIDINCRLRRYCSPGRSVPAVPALSRGASQHIHA